MTDGDTHYFYQMAIEGEANINRHSACNGELKTLKSSLALVESASGATPTPWRP